MGLPYSELDVVLGLGPTRISPTYGLLDATGAGMVEWLGEIGVDAHNDAAADFDEVLAAGGEQPMLIGGRTWCHWVAVRMSSWTAGATGVEALALMNPSPGYMGVEQLLESSDYARLGPFSAVWLELLTPTR
jgi:hypothetical protein